MLNIVFEVTDATGEIISTTTFDADRNDYTNARPNPSSSHIVRIVTGNVGDDVIIISTDMTMDAKTNTKSWCESTIYIRPNNAWSAPIVYKLRPLLVFRIKACSHHNTLISGNGFCMVETRTWQTTLADDDNTSHMPMINGRKSYPQSQTSGNQPI